MKNRGDVFGLEPSQSALVGRIQLPRRGSFLGGVGERSEPERVCKAAGFDGSGCPLPKKWQNKGSTLIYVISLKMGICKCRCPFSAY